MLNNVFLIVISVTTLPTKGLVGKHFTTRALTSASGQSVIVQQNENIYELTCEVEVGPRCSWKILPLKLPQKVTSSVMMTLDDYTC